MTDLTPEEWQRHVDAALEIQSQILTNIQAELIEADRLSNSVERLGDGASDLGAALLQVDKTQQQLTRLGRQLDEVDRQSMTKQAAREQAERERKARLRALRLMILGITAAVGVVAGLVVFVSNSSYEGCKKRQDQTRVLIALLDDFKRAGANGDRITRATDRLEATLDRTCAEQYPINLEN